jgi:hypothetical protein
MIEESLENRKSGPVVPQGLARRLMVEVVGRQQTVKQFVPEHGEDLGLVVHRLRIQGDRGGVVIDQAVASSTLVVAFRIDRLRPVPDHDLPVPEPELMAQTLQVPLHDRPDCCDIHLSVDRLEDRREVLRPARRHLTPPVP